MSTIQRLSYRIYLFLTLCLTLSLLYWYHANNKQWLLFGGGVMLLLVSEVLEFSLIDRHPLWAPLYLTMICGALLLFLAGLVVGSGTTPGWTWGLVVLGISLLALGQAEISLTKSPFSLILGLAGTACYLLGILFLATYRSLPIIGWALCILTIVVGLVSFWPSMADEALIVEAIPDKDLDW